MNGLRATKTVQAVMIAPPVPAHSPSLAARGMPGNARDRQVQPTSESSARMPLNLDRIDRLAEHPAAIKSSRFGAMGPRESKDFQAKSPRATATSKNASQPASDMARWACRL